MRISSRVKNVSASLTLAITAKAKKMKAQGVDVIDFGSGETIFETAIRECQEEAGVNVKLTNLLGCYIAQRI
ncbi:NUDIX domain-containing protein, partial [Patescibacteria group bacterium]|nr:NUDIX domain-containing protein [Patescibacteria group bacterium]